MKKNGRFRKKKVYFTQVSNSALRDKYLSFAAKGLYSLIQSFLTLENFTLYKNYLMEISEEGSTAFNRTWKELKEMGYLKQYKSKDDTGAFYYEYDLLDESEFDDEYRFNKAKEIKKNVYKTANNGFKKKGNIRKNNNTKPDTQTVDVDENVENTPCTQTVDVEKPTYTEQTSGEHESIIILNNNTYSVVVEEEHEKQKTGSSKEPNCQSRANQQSENINVTLVKTKCNLKRNLTKTQIEFMSNCDTDRLLKAINIANEINEDAYTFGYVKEIYLNDSNFENNSKKEKAPSTVPAVKSASHTKNNQIVNNSISQNKHFDNINYKKTKFHNFDETFTQYSDEELNNIIAKSQVAKWGA